MSKTPKPAAAKTTPSTTGERIAKVIARAGITSRREAEKLIETGRVTVNGEVITRAALNVTPADKIVVNGKPLDAPEPARLWLYHKPTGLVTTTRDEQGRPTIYDDLPEELPRVMSVGRLDLNSEGLLLLTNDGAVKREAVGLTVNRLIRTSYGPFQLGQLKPGEVEEVHRRVLRDQLGLDTKDDEDAAESTTKPRKVIVRRNKSRETPSEADLFGDRPGGRPGRGAKPAPRTGKTSTGKPSTGKPASAKAATADAKPAQGRTTGGKAMGSKAMGGRPAAGKPGPDGDRAKGGDKPLRTTRPAKPRPKPTRG